jgi:hypothetical protein
VATATLLEALRSRLGWLLAATGLLALVSCAFAASLALTESGRMQAALSGSAIRIAWVFVFTLHVTGSLVRDLNERGFEHWLALPVSRSAWVLGRAAGFAAAAAAACAALWIPMAALSAPGPAAAWCLGLFAELVVMASAATFFALSLGHLAAAAALAAGFYLLARSLDALRLIAHAGEALTPGPLLDVLRAGLDLLAWLLPALSRYGGSSWLVDAVPPAAALAALLGAALAQSALLLAAALVDFHRRAL